MDMSLSELRELVMDREAWHPLEKGTATQGIILAWKIPGTEEPGRLQSMGSQRENAEGLPSPCPGCQGTHHGGPVP